MPAFHRADVASFVHTSDTELTGLLSIAYANEGFSEQTADQTLAWLSDVRALREALSKLLGMREAARNWTVLLEFNIPRKMRRIDAVLLAGDAIVILEEKNHAPTGEDRLQVEEYALLLHYFHEPSRGRHIFPVLVSPIVRIQEFPARQLELELTETASYWIAPVSSVSWGQLANFLTTLPLSETNPLQARFWENGSYRPVPTIIQAALALRAGVEAGEIAQSSAARHDVDGLTAFVAERVVEAKSMRRHIICFVTGVPGSGKTLVGLNLSFSKRSEEDPIHFMSGNGPLVKVLQEVLARHRMQEGVRAMDARMQARTLIENVHVFAKTYTDQDTDRPPSNHVVIFDEAQRAWNREQNKAKFKRDYSEPEMLLKIMERHADWAVVIALVGGGQEINSGEAGLEEWGRSLATTTQREWTVYASREALEGGRAVAGSSLLRGARVLKCVEQPELHLPVSVRSLRAETYARWVDGVVEGNADRAKACVDDLQFPIFLSRSLPETRSFLVQNTLGKSRCGLVGSSQAARLRAEGLEPDSAFHGGYPWTHWYLAERGDVRASSQLEVFATEFEIQGLELDWVGMCWGGDYVWSEPAKAWQIRAFRASTSKWTQIKHAERRRYRANAYRVLLTRARQGIVIYVPEGGPADPTRSAKEFEETAAFLEACGAKPLLVTKRAQVEDVSPTLF